MAGSYSTLKTWNSNDVLFSLDVNNEFQNVKNNMIATVVEGYSTINNVFSLTRATAEIDPAPGGVYANCIDNQTVAGEIEKLRFVIHRIINGNAAGTTYAQIPSKSLAAGPQSNLSWYLPFYGPTFYHAFQSTVKRGFIANALSRTSLDFPMSSLTSVTTKFAGQYGYTQGVNNILALPGTSNLPDEGSLGLQFYNMNSGDYLFYNPLMGVYFSLGSNSKLLMSVRLPAASGNSAKSFQTISGATIVGGETSWNQATMSYKFNTGISNDSISFYLNGATDGSGNPTTGVSLPVNNDNGGVWFIGAKPNDPTWVTFEAMNVTPDIASGLSGGTTWSTTGAAATSPSVTGGVLSVNSIATSGFSYITKSTTVGINPTSMTVEFKMRIIQTSSTNSSSPFTFFVSNGTVGVQFNAYNSYVQLLASNGSFGSSSDYLNAYLNTNDWHVYRITMNGGSPILTLYIDGVNVGSFTNTSTTSAPNEMFFGSYTGSLTTGQVSWQMEWFAFSDTVTPPVVGNSTGGTLADVFSSLYEITDAPTLNAIGASGSGNIVSLFGRDPVGNMFLPTAVDQYSYSGANFDNRQYLVSDGVSSVFLSSSMLFNAYLGGTTGTNASLLKAIPPASLSGTTVAPSGFELIFNGAVYVPTTNSGIFFPISTSERIVFPQGINAVQWNTPLSGTMMKYSMGRG